MLDQSENPIIPEPSDGEWINSEDDSDSDDDDCSEVRNQAKFLSSRFSILVFISGKFIH